MYSASATDSAMVFCHLEHQLIAPLARVSDCTAFISSFPIFRGSALGDRDRRGDPPSVA